MIPKNSFVYVHMHIKPACYEVVCQEARMIHSVCTGLSHEFCVLTFDALCWNLFLLNVFKKRSRCFTGLIIHMKLFYVTFSVKQLE